MSCRGRRTGDNHQVMRGRHGEEGRGERWRAAAMLCRRRAEKAAGEPSVGPALAAPLVAHMVIFSAERSDVESVLATAAGAKLVQAPTAEACFVRYVAFLK